MSERLSILGFESNLVVLHRVKAGPRVEYYTDSTIAWQTAEMVQRSLGDATQTVEPYPILALCVTAEPTDVRYILFDQHLIADHPARHQTADTHARDMKRVLRLDHDDPYEVAYRIVKPRKTVGHITLEEEDTDVVANLEEEERIVSILRKRPRPLPPTPSADFPEGHRFFAKRSTVRP